MNAVERDDFAHALRETLGFYNKELSKGIFTIWYKALGDKPLPLITRALDSYVQVGKFAPKPVDIRELIDVERAQDQARSPVEQIEYTPCPPEIAKAWMWFIGMTTEDSENLSGVFKSAEIGADLQERYLHIVNHEAQRTGCPEAIPDEFKLKEVWG